MTEPPTTEPPILEPPTAAPPTTTPPTATDDVLDEGLATRAGRHFAAYQAGDQAQMAELVRLLTPILWHTARAARLDASSAEDVLQSVWLSLVRKADTIAEPVAVLQWLVVSTKRESWRVSKVDAKARPADVESGVFNHLDAGRTVEQEVLQEDTRHHLWRHVEQLPERCRTLLRVIAFADKPDYHSLAVSLGMPQGSIGPTRGRCLAKLRVSLAADPTWGRS